MNSNPHELAWLFIALGIASVELAPHPIDPERLRHRPANLPPALLTSLRSHRTAVLQLLKEGGALDLGLTSETASHPEGERPSAPASPLARLLAGDAEYVYCERLGMADGLGMPTHPGSAAWLVAVGEAMESCCHVATLLVECGHGATDQGHCGCGEGERADSRSDRQGRGRGP